ncbi:MAG TPA: hypothetical protein VMF89_07260 [Polyangiales bacterium]|nr:hypothetical protein [Polyangiales bacterium]
MKADDAAAEAVSPRVWAALCASFRMLRERPWTSFLLGAAVSFSLISVCCVLGFATTPFFICELLALQLRAAGVQPLERAPAFTRAGGLLLAGMIMIGAVLVISLLAGTSVSSPTALSPSGVAAALLGSAASWLLLTPLLYAPIMLLEHDVSPELALAHSAHTVLRAGLLANARLACAVFCVQHAPFALAAWLVSIDDGRAALWVLCVAPLVCISVPLGQGMLVSAYVQTAERRAPPTAMPAPFRRWIRVWSLLIVLPILSLVLLELGLSRPARIARVAPNDIPAGEVVHIVVPTDRPQSLELPASALSLQVSTTEVSVTASDGGGVGELPLAAATPIARVRVVRVRDSFAIELTQADGTYLTRIDRAGVRLDDDLPARLRDRSRPWQWLFLLCTLLFTVVSSAPVLAELQPTAANPPPEKALRRARLVALSLLPWGVGSLAMALYLLFTA